MACRGTWCETTYRGPRWAIAGVAAGASTITQQKVRNASAAKGKRHRIVIVTSETPGRAESLAALEAAAWANVRWFLALRERGVEPPCCFGCAGIDYVPDRPAVDVELATGDELVARGRGSCGELVAFEVGRRRAEAIAQGSTPAAAAAVAWPELLLSKVVRNGQGGTDETWHAITRLRDGGLVDPAVEAETDKAKGRR